MQIHSSRGVVGRLLQVAGRLHETRLAGRLPLSWLVIVLLAGLILITGNETRISLQSSRFPTPTPLARIFDADAPANRHVEIEGLLLPEVRVGPARAGTQNASLYCFVAMIGEPPYVLLIRYPASLGTGKPRLVTVSGLLRPMERALVQRLESVGWTLAGVPVERRYVLIPGMSPRPVWLTGSVAVLLILLEVFLIVHEISPRLLAPRRLQHEDPTV